MFGDLEQEMIELPSPHGDGRWGRVHTFYDALLEGRSATCRRTLGQGHARSILAILQSGNERREIMLEHQTSTNDAGLVPAQEWTEVVSQYTAPREKEERRPEIFRPTF